MAPSLWKWGGLGVLVALAWSVYHKPARTDAAVSHAMAGTTGLPQARDQGVAPGVLPPRLTRAPLESASRDPFASTPAPSAPPPVAKPVAPVVPAPPPPAPPPLNLRYAGRMTGPDGATQVFVLFGETGLTASVGQTLPNGYRVEAVTPRAIEMSYPPLNSTARLDLPAPPQHEIR